MSQLTLCILFKLWWFTSREHDLFDFDPNDYKQNKENFMWYAILDVMHLIWHDSVYFNFDKFNSNDLERSKIISRRATTCDSVHSWWLYSAATLANQAVSTMIWYPTQSYYQPVLPFLILIMPSAWLGSDKYKFWKSLVWLSPGLEPMMFESPDRPKWDIHSSIPPGHYVILTFRIIGGKHLTVLTKCNII